MIVFLTLCYLALLAVLVQIGLVRLNLWWKLSPLVWVLILLIVLFIPMQWGAPAGAVRLYKPVIEVIPNVSGEVIEVPGRPLEPMSEGDVIFRIDPTTYEAKVEQIEANLVLAQLNLERARQLFTRKTAPKADVDRYEAEAALLQAQLKEAKWSLDKTKVRAPSDGYLVGLQLRPGQRVSQLAVRSWAAFVDTENSRLIAGIPQSRLRHVEPGQKAEIAFRLLPGRVIDAEVVAVAPVTVQGQLQPTGQAPTAPLAQEVPLPYGVVLALQDDEVLKAIHSGAAGTAAIYTSSSRVTHIIRKVMLRMEAWLNYLNPA